MAWAWHRPVWPGFTFEANMDLLKNVQKEKPTVRAPADNALAGRQLHQMQTRLQLWGRRSILQTAGFKQTGSTCL